MAGPHRLTGLLMAGVMIACDSDSTGVRNEEPVVDCGDDVTSVSVTVSSAASPVLDWSPRCRVALLLIEADAHDMWSLRGDEDSNDVAPPVTYGVAPQGLTGSEPEPLVDGETYEVVLWHTSEQGARLLAVHEFVR